MTATETRSRKWILVSAILLGVLLLGGVFLSWRARHMDNAIRLWVIRSLSNHFQSRVELATLRVTGFPHLGVTGEDLTIYFHDRTDVPPIVHGDKLSFGLGALAIFRLPRHIASANIENMPVTIPPRGEKTTPESSDAGKTKNALTSLIVDEVICKNTVLITLPRKPDPGKPAKEPL